MSYRYIGNKTKLIPWLLPLIKSIVKPGATVIDLMCGTASVSEALRLSNYRVIAADVMTFAAYHARVRLMMERAPSFKRLGVLSYVDMLWMLQSIEPEQGYMFREYSPGGHPLSGDKPRGYFTDENAAKIDAIQKQITQWDAGGNITCDERALLRHDLVLAANRVANIAGTYGHFRSSWSESALAPIALKPTKFIPGYQTGHQVLQGYAEVLAPRVTGDLCYIDPPYMKRQYAANYHILETLARGDEPDAIGVSGLRPWRDQYSNFCSKVRIRDAFRLILGAMQCPSFLISYSEDGLLTQQELMDLLSEFGVVTIHRYPYQRFRSNNSDLGAIVTEYVFHLTKNGF